MRRARRLTRDDGGFTLVELIVASGVLAVALGVTFSLLFSLQSVVVGQQQRTDNNDQARMAVERLDRDIRSGNVLLDPASEATPYYALRVYTQSNADEPANPSRCVQWRVQSRELQRRSWPPSYGSTPDPSTVTAWRTEAKAIVNQDLAVRAFEASVLTPDGVRTVAIVIAANSALDNHPSQTLRIQISSTGRNTIFSYPQNACSPAPA
jgi:prepilin-type N-terminal cleavage/methylation domain-containing protein